MKYVKIFIPVLIALGLVSWGAVTLGSNKEKIDEKASKKEKIIAQIPVNVSDVFIETAVNEIELVGSFEARKELTVIAETQGIITSMNVVEGQVVKKGELIASVNSEAITSQLATAKSSYAKAVKDVERYSNLLEAGAISQTQYEDVKLAAQNQETNITSLQQQLKYAKVESPMNGVIKEVLLEDGSFASPGMQLASIVDIEILKMIVFVDEKAIVKIGQNQVVDIITEVYPNIVFKGKVSQIGVQANDVKKFEVAIEMINSKDNPLKAGMYGKVIIPFNDAVPTKSLTIPRKSLVGGLKQPKVYVVENGKAILKDIQIGESIGDNIIVLEGLTKNDKVITTGQINLENGREVTVIEEI